MQFEPPLSSPVPQICVVATLFVASRTGHSKITEVGATLVTKSGNRRNCLVRVAQERQMSLPLMARQGGLSSLPLCGSFCAGQEDSFDGVEVGFGIDPDRVRRGGGYVEGDAVVE